MTPPVLHRVMKTLGPYLNHFNFTDADEEEEEKKEKEESSSGRGGIPPFRV